MCGIFGIFAFRPEHRPTVDALRGMGDISAHRGPDDFGSHIDGNLGIGMRRLSIIDVEGGHQPLRTSDGKIWAICNGEIYNFLEQRRRLEQCGHKFQTNSDSEVLLHAYREYGDAFLDHIDGMFGFALWDAPKRRLLVGRDRLGIKPLYISVDENRFVFASEVKSILKLEGVQAEMNEAALRSYLELGYSARTETLFKGILKLRPATVLAVTDEGLTERQYWRLTSAVATDTRIEDWAEEVRTTLDRAVRAQMISDVPLGAFLSGGMDSSAVVASMAAASDSPVKTYSVGFDTGSAAQLYNELPYARQIAKRFGTDHHEIVVRPKVAELLPKLVWHLDEPIADSAMITTYLVAEFARRDVTVILSGVGGDELFGGYRRYLGESLVGLYQRIPAALRRRFLEPLANRLPSDRHNRWLNYLRLAKAFIRSADENQRERYRSYVTVFADPLTSELMGERRPPSYVDALSEAFDEAGQDDLLNKLMEVDLATQLPEDLLLLTDKATMAASLECRVPLLDTALVDLAFRIPGQCKVRNGKLKYVLKQALAGALPRNILHREKRGFGAPVGAWIKQELKPVYDHLLGRRRLAGRGLFDPDVLGRIIKSHERAQEDHSDHLQALANLEIWIQLFMEGRRPDDLADELQSIMGK